ncbi:hypothetical protein GY45DRAFT_1371106 [Cubamyces sp. BRFM 1775]|nr:hypothetical protein GY45DRAFT_1371106 [Cubamyces sp. BRFM 1775]
MAEAAAQAEAQVQQLVQVISDTYVANLCTAAAATWLCYDIVLTFSQEVDLVWRAKWSLPKLLFVLVRYYTLLSLLLTLAVNTNRGLSFEALRSCQRWLWYNGFNGALLSAVVGEAIFLMRLYASYNRTKTILCTIVFLFSVEFVTGITTASFVVSSLSVTPRPPDFPLPGCLFTAPKHVNLSKMVWAVAMSVTCVYFLLILYKFARNLSLRKTGTSSSVPVWELQRISPVVFAFLRDSAFYFFLVFLGNLLNLVFEFIFAGRALIPMGTVWLMVIYGLSASRLSLNTRDSVSRSRGQSEWDWHEPEDDIEMDAHASESQPSNSAASLSSGGGEIRDVGHTVMFTQGAGRPRPYRSGFDRNMVSVLESNDGRRATTSELRSPTYDSEMDSWLVVDAHGQARRMSYIIQDRDPL